MTNVSQVSHHGYLLGTNPTNKHGTPKIGGWVVDVNVDFQLFPGLRVCDRGCTVLTMKKEVLFAN